MNLRKILATSTILLGFSGIVTGDAVCKVAQKMPDKDGINITRKQELQDYGNILRVGSLYVSFGGIVSGIALNTNQVQQAYKRWEKR